jgi:hypothetical protein
MDLPENRSITIGLASDYFKIRMVHQIRTNLKYSTESNESDCTKGCSNLRYKNHRSFSSSEKLLCRFFIAGKKMILPD